MEKTVTATNSAENGNKELALQSQPTQIPRMYSLTQFLYIHMIVKYYSCENVHRLLISSNEGLNEQFQISPRGMPAADCVTSHVK